MIEYSFPMTQDARQLLDQVLAFCDSKWVEAHEAPTTGWMTAEMQTARKIAYNDVKHFVAKLLDGTPSPKTD